MNPVIDDVFKPSLMQGLFHGVMLFPNPLPGLPFDRAPGDIILVHYQSAVLEANLRFDRRGRFEKIRLRKGADGRSLNKTHRQIPTRNIPGPPIEWVVRLAEA